MPETYDESFELTLLQVIGAGSAVDFIQRLWRPDLLCFDLGPIAGIDNGRGMVQSISIFAESGHIDRGVVLHRIGCWIAQWNEDFVEGEDSHIIGLEPEQIGSELSFDPCRGTLSIHPSLKQRDHAA
jgi:hypothetical protein